MSVRVASRSEASPIGEESRRLHRSGRSIGDGMRLPLLGSALLAQALAEKKATLHDR